MTSNDNHPQKRLPMQTHVRYWLLRDASGHPRMISPSYSEVAAQRGEGEEVVPVMECRTDWKHRAMLVASVLLALALPLGILTLVILELVAALRLL